jgi:hypothetical protein
VGFAASKHHILTLASDKRGLNTEQMIFTAIKQSITASVTVRKSHITNVLKGHGNEADFLGFLQKSVRHRFLTLHLEPFRFGLRIFAEIFVIKNDSPTESGSDKNAYRYCSAQTRTRMGCLRKPPGVELIPTVD